MLYLKLRPCRRHVLEVVMQGFAGAEKLEFNKLQKKLRGGAGRAIADFNMIEDGDRIMVCLSGGKDSFTMLHILMSLQKSNLCREALPMKCDQG